MKTSSKISLIAIASTLALTGTAFAAWQFNKNAEVNSASNVVVTKDTSTGTINVYPTTFYLTLDQDVLAWTLTDHTDDEDEVTDEITTVNFEYTGSSKTNDVSDVILSVTYFIDSGLETYVSILGGDLATPSVSGNVKSATYTLPILSWANKPTTQAAFNTMKAAVSSLKVTFTFTATVV